jgi:hypothetical protein
MQLLQIYYASEAFGHIDIRTSGGYFQLAKVFNELNESVVADSLFDKVGIYSAACFSLCGVVANEDILLPFAPVCKI